MTLLVDSLIKCARELLHWVDQDLVSFAIHLKAFSEGIAFTLNHSLPSEDHVVEDFVVEHVNFASGLIILLKNVLISLVDFLVQVVLHL